MYVITFYSFKGGVGRTMALVNVASALARRGQKVLLVDFDLEAPGIDSFGFQRRKPDGPGIVEFVSDYLKTQTAPNVLDYVYEAENMGECRGSISIMPAGRQDGTYSSRLNAIDWRRLYEENEGYLLFEDLKAQWQERVQPDYVLIDSRTGHTDVGGICTRQLPDAVVVLFIPNDQNLNGLKKVVRDIRSEATEPRKKEIELHFVMSNIPAIDDEDQILARRKEQFSSTLEYSSLATTIHKYDSLELLDQVLFTKTRPMTRLAREYVKLVDRLVEHNPRDRDGALSWLRKLEKPSFWAKNALDRSDVLTSAGKIHKAHPKDPEVLLRLARLLRRLGQHSQALGYLDEIPKTVPISPRVLLLRAECNQVCGKLEDASKDFQAVLHLEDIPDDQAVFATEMLSLVDRKALSTLSTAAGILKCVPQVVLSIAKILARSKENLGLADSLLSQCLNRGSHDHAIRNTLVSELALSKIGMGEFKGAMELIGGKERPSAATLDMAGAFNFGVAEWGHSGNPPKDMFLRVLEMGKDDDPNDFDVNHSQCFALSNWVVGDTEAARKWLERAFREVEDSHGFNFSCWRYTYCNPREFRADLEALQQMVEGLKQRPIVLKQNR